MDERTFAIIQGTDLWKRAAFSETTLESEGAVVRLAYAPESAAKSSREDSADLPPPLGLARDPWCRLYVAFPAQGRLLRQTPREGAPAEISELFGPRPLEVGDFTIALDPGQGLDEPVALAVDGGGRLFIAERAARRIRVFDLVDRRLLRTILLADEPVALACAGQRVRVLTAERIGLFDTFGAPVFEPLPEAVRGAEALALDHRGLPLLLLARGTDDARIVPLANKDEPLEVPRASALAWRGNDELVVARGRREPFRRFRLSGEDRFEGAALDAPDYDGDGILVDHAGRVLYWTANGLKRTRPTRQRFRPCGRVTGFALDSGRFQNQWGRLFIDACIPKGSRIRVHCLALDEAPGGSIPLKRTPPVNAETLTIRHPQLSPPMPPRDLVENLEPALTLHRRSRGPELPWADPNAAAPFVTYEAPVIAQPGRQLWVVLELSSSTHATPRVRAVRAEIQGHDWMRRLPRIYSAEPAAADFLRRWLALLDGDYHDLELRAAARHMLLDPASAPTEALPWLAGFVGLALDRRWPENARRSLISEAIWLFRYRGTVPGLKRMLQIYLGIPKDQPERLAIIEHFKVRGLGGALVGSSKALRSSSVLGAGFRVGGSISGGADAESVVSVGSDTLGQSVDKAAHRFTVVLPVLLDEEQHGVVKQILDLHRPAHTIYDICSLDAGMRIGIVLYAGLTSLIGRSAGFGILQAGGSLLGFHDLVRGDLSEDLSVALIGDTQIASSTSGDWNRFCVTGTGGDKDQTPADPWGACDG